MTIEDLERTIEEHVGTSSEELADDLYDHVKASLDHGEDRAEIYRLLRQYYDLTRERGLRREHRAAGVVLSYLDGYCSPMSTL